MLGPFRIRNLRRSPSLPPTRPGVGWQDWQPTSTDAVVCVDGDIYEDEVRHEPASRLKYIDSDNDVVTVGSKKELRDRLAEPVRPYRSNHDLSVPLKPASPAMHVFEIDQMEAAVRFWRSVEAEAEQAQAKGVKHPVPVVDSVSYPTLEDKRTAYFKSTQPPPLQPVEPSVSCVPTCYATANALVSSSSNVLTQEGIKQAQQAGAQLRARLTSAAPNPPQPKRVDRASAVNSWATYSKDTVPSWSSWKSLSEYTSSKNARAPPDDMEPVASSSRVSPSAAALDLMVLGKNSHKDPQGSLHPNFYENVQSSLDKLSPNAAQTRDAEVSESSSGKMPEVTPLPIRGKQADVPESKGEEDSDRLEAVEITLAKMVFQTIRDMSKTLETMNEQFDKCLTPKLVAERLKSKDKLLPAHRQDTVRDIFALRRSIEAFALEVAETKQTLTRLDQGSVFPEGTNLMDFSSMTAAAYSFGRMIRSMDDMIITARRGMLAAQLADGEPKYHTPRRLARLGYEDVWSIHIVPIPSHYSSTSVHNLVDEIRSEYSLAPLDVRTIIFHDGPERSVEIEIEGKARATETWGCLLKAPKRSIRLPLSERQITLTRKHYPDVLRCPSVQEKVKEQTPAASLLPPSRADIDVARLKALQDRRAAWRREFKARTQSVRFQEPRKIGVSAGAPEVTKPPQVLPKPKVNTPGPPPPWMSGFGIFGATANEISENRERLLGPHNASNPSLPLAPRAVGQALRRAKSASFKHSKESDVCGAALEPRTGPAADFHRLRYPPGPFAPPPPQRQVPSAAKPLPYDPAKDAQRAPEGSVAQPSKAPSQPFVPAFPPLPPLEPLVPKRRYSPIPKSKPTAPESSTLPGAWPEVETQEGESSGAFFRRMMGRSPAPSHDISPISSPTLPATQPPADVRRPVSPISLSSLYAGPVSEESLARKHHLRRSATMIHTGGVHASRPEKSASGPWSRRPYSMTFDGRGRTDDTFRSDSQPLSRNRSRSPPKASLRLGPIPPRPTPIQTPAPATASVPAPSTVAASARRSAPVFVPVVYKGAALPEPEGPEGPELDVAVQTCVDQLKELGYGDAHNGGNSRLLMYAQMAEGELEATIDLIEEERAAWQEHGIATKEDGARDI